MTESENTTLYLPKFCIVPLQARLDKTLNDGAKIYLGEINVLTSKYGYCTATDEQLAEMKGVSIRTIKSWNKDLEDRKFIKRITWREHYKNPKGKGVFIRSKRKLYVIDEVLNKYVEEQETAPPIEEQETAPHIEGQKTAPFLNIQSEDDNLKNNNKGSDEEVPFEAKPPKPPVVVSPKNEDQDRKPPVVVSPKNEDQDRKPPVVVPTKIEELAISDEECGKLRKLLSNEDLSLMVKRVERWKTRDSDSKACNVILKSWNKWNDEPTQEEIQEAKDRVTKKNQDIETCRRDRALELKERFPKANFEIGEKVMHQKNKRGTSVIAFLDDQAEAFLDSVEKFCKQGTICQKTG